VNGPFTRSTNGGFVTILGIDEPPQLQRNGHLRMAVWALRVGFLALAVAIAGIIGWLAAAAITVTGVVKAQKELAEPRPGFWPLRFMLLHDTFHARSSPQ
jgi:hypothetical protein